MGCVAKTKKIKFSKMLMEDVLLTLVTKYVLYLRGEEMFKFNGVPVDTTVTYHEDGSFTPTEEGIWERQVRHRMKEESWPKYIDMFKQSISKEWNASKKSSSTATESQS